MKQFKRDQDYSSVVMTPKTTEVGWKVHHMHMDITYACMMYALVCRAMYVICFVLCSDEFGDESRMFCLVYCSCLYSWWLLSKSNLHLETLPVWVLPCC